MHVNSNGDPVEITGEWDSLAISCDLFTLVVNMLMSMCKRGNCMIRFIVRIQIAEIVQRRQAVWTQELAHIFANLCMIV
jgi:hypothetical protein